jgi:ribose transport system permease protein
MTAIAQEREKQSLIQWIKKHSSTVASLGGLVFCIIFFTIGTGLKGESIWSGDKLSTLIGDVIVTALMAVGAVFIYSLGNMDVSIGRQIGLYSTMLVLIGNATGSLLPGILACIAVAVIIGIINGAAGELLHMYSVISSVVFMMVISGITTIIYSNVGSKNIILSGVDLSFFRSPVNMVIVLVIEYLVIGYFFYFTKFGKYARSIGANQTAAAQSGVNIIKYRVIPYIFLAFCLVTASLFQMGYTGAASDATGTGFEMNVMVSLILGGMPLKGGMKSRLSCAVIGALTFSLLAVGLPIIGVPTRMTFMIKAIIFLVVVLITCRQKSGPLPR